MRADLSRFLAIFQYALPNRVEPALLRVFKQHKGEKMDSIKVAF